MKKFKQFLLSEYQECSIHKQRKASYAIIFVFIIFCYTAISAIIDISVQHFTIARAVEFGIYFIVLLICLAFFQFGYLEIMTNILMAIGIARTISIMFWDYSVYMIIMVTMISLLATALIHVKKYQVVIVFLFYLIFYLITTIFAFMGYLSGVENIAVIGDKLQGFTGMLVFMILTSFVIKIINQEIKKTTELESARAASVMYFEELEKMSIRLSEMASTDKLTGILNRRKFHENLTLEIDKSDRYGRPLGLLMIDLDHFKSINDSYGHLCGDEVLKAFCVLIVENIRRTDIFVRWGGEEFIVIAPELNKEQTIEFGEKLKSAVENYEFDEIRDLTISIGAYNYNKGETVDQIIKGLDDNLYYAKKHGRNQVYGG